MESKTHKRLRHSVGRILRKYGWNPRFTKGGVSDVDIIAKKGSKTWKIEIEYSGTKENIRADLDNGAQIFVAPIARMPTVQKIVYCLGSKAPVVAIGRIEYVCKNNLI